MTAEDFRDDFLPICFNLGDCDMASHQPRCLLLQQTGRRIDTKDDGDVGTVHDRGSGGPVRGVSASSNLPVPGTRARYDYSSLTTSAFTPSSAFRQSDGGMVVWKTLVSSVPMRSHTSCCLAKCASGVWPMVGMAMYHYFGGTFQETRAGFSLSSLYGVGS